MFVLGFYSINIDIIMMKMMISEYNLTSVSRLFLILFRNSFLFFCNSLCACLVVEPEFYIFPQCKRIKNCSQVPSTWVAKALLCWSWERLGRNNQISPIFLLPWIFSFQTLVPQTAMQSRMGKVLSEWAWVERVTVVRNNFSKGAWTSI